MLLKFLSDLTATVRGIDPSGILILSRTSSECGHPAGPDPNEARGGSRVIHLYIWPTTDRQVVASNFRVSEVATIPCPRAGASLRNVINDPN